MPDYSILTKFHSEVNLTQEQREALIAVVNAAVTERIEGVPETSINYYLEINLDGPPWRVGEHT